MELAYVEVFAELFNSNADDNLERIEDKPCTEGINVERCIDSIIVLVWLLISIFTGWRTVGNILH